MRLASWSLPSPRRAAAMAALGIATLAGCGDDETQANQQSSGGNSGTGAGGQGGSTFDPPVCGGLSEAFTNPECGECAEQSCCAELEVCADGTPCGALRECKSGCFDQACATACEGTHPDGVAPSGALDGCLGGPCAAACPVSTGLCGTSFTTGSAECDTCVGGACCPELEACAMDAVCDGCLKASPESCEMDPLFTAVSTCFEGSCAVACGG